jgi:hypothetical protein
MSVYTSIKVIRTIMQRFYSSDVNINRAVYIKTKFEQANKREKNRLSVLSFFFFSSVGVGGLGANIVMTSKQIKQ